jgi:hypothetical protein
MNLSFHFNIDVDESRKLVIAKIYGIWKEETAREYVEEYQEVVKPLLGDKWARLTNLSNWKSSYPEIIQVLGEHMTWCRENGAVYSLYCIENPVTMRQLRAMVEKSTMGESAMVFNSVAEANKFLAEKGF